MVASACFGYERNGSIDVAGASEALWGNGRACGIGATNMVPHPCRNGTSSIVEIVDFCPKCKSTINLSLDAFSPIADPRAGRIKIEYKLV